MTENTLDETTLSTLSLLESRLLRIEHLLHGYTASTPVANNDSALRRLNQMDRRFATLMSDFRIYGELLKICAWPCSSTLLYPLASSLTIR
jgi:hypothetical protein